MLSEASRPLQKLLYALTLYAKVPVPPRHRSIFSMGNSAGICAASLSLLIKITFFAVAGSMKGCKACTPHQESVIIIYVSSHLARMNLPDRVL